MGQKLTVGPFNRGLRNDLTAFNIDNDSFPTLINAYQWRGRVKRKRGTVPLVRLKRYFNSTSTAYGSVTSFNLVANAGNLLTGFSLQTDGNIVPGTVSFVVGANTYTDPSMDGTLTGAPGGSGTINYATGDIVVSGGGAGAVTNASFFYYPDLPVMGLEDLVLNATNFPQTLAFDTKYSYRITNNKPFNAYDVSFYKNLATGTYTNYVQKSTWTPTSWNGADYQQFWTTNYQGALWATNGVETNFSSAGTSVGMQYSPAADISAVSRTSATTMQMTIANCPLVIGDFVFLNEFTASAGGDASTLNLQTGYITACSVNTPPLAAKTVTITFPNATITAGTYTPGIVQYLTTRRSTSLDCIRWYDGDPVNGANPPVFSLGKGWVNFSPPLSQASFSIGDAPAAQYYLAGCKMIVPFKDRLLFIAPVIQTAGTTPTKIFLPDTVVYSQNGTPYYTASFTGSVTAPTTVFNPILVPDNQTASAAAYLSDSTGFGGFISAGYQMSVNTTSSNQDVLIMGFDSLQARFVYTGNDIVPFNFYVINSEYGSSSTFSSINMDDGVLTRGSRGYVMTSQSNCRRFDNEIPDLVYQINLDNNGQERICAQRDFENEWIYFTFNGDSTNSRFPNSTLQYNYRDNSWAVFYESYTTYGQFRVSVGNTWETIGADVKTWNGWNSPWNQGFTTVNEPQVIAGNQQGFVVIRDSDTTSEASSLFIQSISNATITSPDHGLNNGDFIYITGALGTVSQQINGKIFSVGNVTSDTFVLTGTSPVASGTYFGGGLITRLYRPYIQTKQFPLAWDMARKTRIGVQQYLLTTTDDAQIQLLIFLSQNSSSAYNTGGIVPSIDTSNNSLVYSTVLYTCPESTNLGLTTYTSNLQMPTAIQQDQIWHRMNTSLIGDTIQIGFTISDEQMRSFSIVGQTPKEITGATQANPCVLSCVNNFEVGQVVYIQDVEGMVELNGNYYIITAASSTTVTIDVDASGFTAYTEGGTATVAGLENQTAEIELHGIIMDVTQSQMLS